VRCPARAQRQEISTLGLTYESGTKTPDRNGAVRWRYSRPQTTWRYDTMKLSAGSGQRRQGPYPDLTMTIDAEVDVPVAMVQLARFSMAGPSDCCYDLRKSFVSRASPATSSSNPLLHRSRLSSAATARRSRRVRHEEASPLGGCASLTNDSESLARHPSYPSSPGSVVCRCDNLHAVFARAAASPSATMQQAVNSITRGNCCPLVTARSQWPIL
jgi:hypothetical protein